jgi:rfaE bifunctional protein kinase chain/domain
MSFDFLNKYSHKIKTLKEIKKKLPSNKKIILCHGHFDVVHPGHVRHLIYAKSKADILIVSITGDIHVTKGVNRPHVPENIRALNIAAFEVVDFVLIDQNYKPLSLIKSLRPDYFAKGFEYSSNKLPAATQEELKLINSYGGKMIFTPGDVVYSSTRILKESPPELKIEKLLSVMKSNNIDFTKLLKTIKDFKNLSIHVLGDVIVDTYTETLLIGGQTKTPTLSVLKNSETHYIGGAGVVALNLANTGAKVLLSTVVGKDFFGKLVQKNLKKKLTLLPVIDNTRPTTNKNSIVCKDYKLVKIDTLDNQPISKKVLNSLSKQLKKHNTSGVIFSDFRHGIFNGGSIESLTKSVKKNTFKSADSQVASRWGNITDFKNFDLITPNEKEARFSISDQDSSLSSLARKVIKASKCKNMILKLGERGAFAVENKKYLKSFYVSSFANKVADAVGTGDALLAYSTLAMISSKSLAVSIIIGSIAAACKCESQGNSPITPKEVIEKIKNIEKLTKYNTL